MRKVVKFYFVTSMTMFLAVAAMGQVTVNVPGVAKRSFAVTGFSGDATAASQVAEVLKNDLQLSGLFRLAPSASAEFVQQGSVRIERGNGFIDCTVTLQSTRKVVLSKTYQGSTQDLRRMVHQLSNDIVQAIIGQQGIAQTKIAFAWSHGGVKEIAVMDYDGHNARQLTNDRTISVRPRWSPNGRKIVYTSYKSRFPDVMEIELTAATVKNKDKEVMHVVMKAELKCPAQDGNSVSAWTKSEEIFSGDPKKMASPRAAKTLLMPKVNKFFVQFQKDVHEAIRVKAEPK